MGREGQEGKDRGVRKRIRVCTELNTHWRRFHSHNTTPPRFPPLPAHPSSTLSFPVQLEYDEQKYITHHTFRDNEVANLAYPSYPPHTPKTETSPSTPHIHISPPSPHSPPSSSSSPLPSHSHYQWRSNADTPPASKVSRSRCLGRPWRGWKKRRTMGSSRGACGSRGSVRGFV